MKRYTFFCIVVLLFTAGSWSFAQESPFVATPYQTINIFEGPGITYLQSGRIEAGVPFEIVERNHTGTWVHIRRTREDGSAIYDGWVISGYLNLSPLLSFGDVPVNTTAPDAVPENGTFQLRGLHAVPVISPIDEAMHAVYERGRDEMQNFSDVATKVGDSLSADPLYLTPFSQPDVSLSAYRYLADAVSYFGASLARNSVAVRVGMTSYTVLDPQWADPSACQPGESPLECEYRVKKPSVALIMFGPNDVLHMRDVEFDVQMRAIVDHSLDHGVIPVLSTFSYDPGMGVWNQAVAFNERLVAIANDYHVPLINLWLAARALPQYGLEIDHVHLKHWGSNSIVFGGGQDAYSGAALRNLLSMRMLDEIRRTIILDPDAAG